MHFCNSADCTQIQAVPMFAYCRSKMRRCWRSCMPASAPSATSCRKPAPVLLTWRPSCPTSMPGKLDRGHTHDLEWHNAPAVLMLMSGPCQAVILPALWSVASHAAGGFPILCNCLRTVR
jgi:hypothetical protein